MSSLFNIKVCVPAWVWCFANKIVCYITGRESNFRGFGGVWPFVLYAKLEQPYQQGVIVHELTHIVQQVQHPFTFHIKYLYYHFKYGYKKNPYEVAARKTQYEYYMRYRKLRAISKDLKKYDV